MTIITLERLKEFLESCINIFAPYSDVEENDVNIETYVLNIDYEKDLAFDTTLIVSGGASSSMLGVGQLGTMIIGS